MTNTGVGGGQGRRARRPSPVRRKLCTHLDDVPYPPNMYSFWPTTTDAAPDRGPGMAPWVWIFLHTLRVALPCGRGFAGPAPAPDDDMLIM